MPQMEILPRRGRNQLPRRRITKTGQIVPAAWYFLDENHVTTLQYDPAKARGLAPIYISSDITARWGLTDSITRTLIRRVQWNGGTFEIGGWDALGIGKGGRRLFVVGDTFLRDFARVLAKYPVKPINRALTAVHGVSHMVTDRAGTGLTVADFRATATEVIGLAAQFTDAAHALAAKVNVEFPMPTLAVVKLARHARRQRTAK